MNLKRYEKSFEKITDTFEVTHLNLRFDNDKCSNLIPIPCKKLVTKTCTHLKFSAQNDNDVSRFLNRYFKFFSELRFIKCSGNLKKGLDLRKFPKLEKFSQNVQNSAALSLIHILIGPNLKKIKLNGYWNS